MDFRLFTTQRNLCRSTRIHVYRQFLPMQTDWQFSNLSTCISPTRVDSLNAENAESSQIVRRKFIVRIDKLTLSSWSMISPMVLPLLNESLWPPASLFEWISSSAGEGESLPPSIRFSWKIHLSFSFTKDRRLTSPKFRLAFCSRKLLKSNLGRNSLNIVGREKVWIFFLKISNDTSEVWFGIIHFTIHN